MEERRDGRAGRPDGPREGRPPAADDVIPREPSQDEWFGTLWKTMFVVSLGGIAYLGISEMRPLHTRSAPASARIEYERRRAEAERAIAEADRAKAEEDDKQSEGEGSRE